MSQDMSFPLEAVGEAAATELTGEALLDSARHRAAVDAAGGRRKDLWEIRVHGHIQCSIHRKSILHT